AVRRARFTARNRPATIDHRRAASALDAQQSPGAALCQRACKACTFNRGWIAEFRGGNGIRVCSGALPDERREVRRSLVVEIATGVLYIHRQEQKGIPGCSDRPHVPGDFQLERVYV